MPITTVDIDAPLLDEQKRLQKVEGKSLGSVISELVAEALAFRERGRQRSTALHWNSQRVRPRVDLSVHDAVQDAMDLPDFEA